MSAVYQLRMCTGTAFMALVVLAMFVLNGQDLTNIYTSKPMLHREQNITSKTSKTYHNHNNLEVIQILYWNKYHPLGKHYRGDKFVWGIGNDRFQHCRVSNCITTTGDSVFNSSDVILINPRYKSLPKYRKSNQVWLLTAFETPHTMSIPPQFYGMFNATYTYMEGSDIRGRLFGMVAGGSMNMTVTMLQPNGRPKRLVAWVASNRCTNQNGRLQYVMMLRDFIPVDVFGKCGNLTCPGNEMPGWGTSPPFNPCHTMVAESYLFYLAFENSNCHDYVTEKAFRSLQLGIIPVVYGLANYIDVLSSHSFINIRDFASPKQLADHLYHVSRDPALYSSYFTWRDKQRIVEPQQYEACVACEALHKLKAKLPQVVDIQTFWNKDNNCDLGRLTWMTQSNID